MFAKGNDDEKEFHLFKLIEIIDSETVKEHYEFQHPKYLHKGNKTNQYLFFNQSADRMIEVLNFQRVNIYDKSMLN